MDLVKDYFKIKKYFQKFENNVVDTTFVVYTRHTSRLLLMLSLFYATIFMNFDHVTCAVLSSEVQQGFIQDMCIQTYYRAHQDVEVIYLDTDLASQLPSDSNETESYIVSKLVQYEYYEWIFILLLFQAFLCYLPWIVLRSNEFYKIHQLRRLNQIVELCEHDTQYDPNNPNQKSNKQRKLLLNLSRNFQGQLQFVLSLMQDWTNQSYVSQFILAQIVSVVTILAQIGMLHFVFNCKYLDFGIRWIMYALGYDSNPRETLFPIITTCQFRNYGPTGAIQFIDSICTLNYNLLNTYLYTFLWFYYAILMVYMLVPIVREMILFWLPKCRSNRMDRARKIHTIIQQWKSTRKQPQQHSNSAEEELISTTTIHLPTIKREKYEDFIDKMDDSDMITIYYWTLTMLELTTINIENLVDKIKALVVPIEIETMPVAANDNNNFKHE